MKFSMKHRMIQVIKDNFSWMKDIAIVVGIAALLFLNARYVTIDKFEVSEKANQLAHASIQVTLVNIDKTLALQAQNQELLIAQQKQIVINTTKINELDVRMRNVESYDVGSFRASFMIKDTELEGRIKTLESHTLNSLPHPTPK